MISVRTNLVLIINLVIAPAALSAPRCVPQYSTKELCVLPSANMSRVHESPEILVAAQVVALKMRPYYPENDPRMYLTMGYRSPAEQERIRRTGVRAGPSSGKFVSAHIYGVALDVEIHSRRQLGHEMCAALNQIMPLLKDKGGVIMEGTGGGSTNGHIDDNWGARFSMEKTGKHQSLNYTGPECPPSYGVSGATAEKFADMAKITEKTLEESHSASLEEDEQAVAPEDEEAAATPAASKKAGGKDETRKPSSFVKYH
ncbi:MAG: hypothetical protein ACXWR4_08365 [Bdellovibrionota bacterium]